VQFMLHPVWVLCQDDLGRVQVPGDTDGLQIWRVAANVLNKQSRTACRASGLVGKLANSRQCML
jgi:hypothetical protein